MILFGHLGLTLATVRTVEKHVFRRQLATDKAIFVASILPDIIDKLIGRVLLDGVFNSGRLFAHTLLFVMVLALAGWMMRDRAAGKYIMLVSFCALIHDVFDRMWEFKETLFWPYFGWEFPFMSTNSDWLAFWKENIFNPVYFGPELLGLAYLVWYYNRKRINQEWQE